MAAPGVSPGPVSDQVALRRLGVLVPNEPESEKLVPSLAGLLTLGAYPQQFFPQLNVTFVVFPSDQAGIVPGGRAAIHRQPLAERCDPLGRVRCRGRHHKEHAARGHRAGSRQARRIRVPG